MITDAMTIEDQAGQQAVVAPPPAHRLAEELAVIATLWRRDMLHLARERSRWLGVVLQPLLFWLVLGAGMADSFHLASNTETSYLTYFFPGTLVMVVLFTTIFGTISVIEDRQSGFLQGVLVAPGSRASMVLGKALGVTTMVLVQAALLLALSPLAGYPYTQISWPLLLLVLVLGSLGLTALSFAMAWWLNSSQAYHAMMMVVLLPLWIVSGAMFPATHPWVRVFMTINPMTYIVAGVRSTMGGAGTSVGLLSSLLVMIAFMVASLALAVYTVRPRQQDRGKRRH